MACASLHRHIVLTGPPGVGKTTLIRKMCEALKESGISTQGFYTEELRANRRRTGFDVVTLDGNRGPLARVRQEPTLPGEKDYRVGQYSVELYAFEQTALPMLQLKDSSKAPVYVIDEIGKMEMFSNKFKQDVRKLLDTPSTTVVATIPIPKGKPIPLVEDIRSRKDVKLFTVTKENRDGILPDIKEAILQSYSKPKS